MGDPKKLFAVLDKEIKKQKLAYLQKESTTLGVPFAKIRNLKEVFELPEAKKLIREIKAGGKNYRVITSFPAKIG